MIEHVRMNIDEILICIVFYNVFYEVFVYFYQKKEKQVGGVLKCDCNVWMKEQQKK